MSPRADNATIPGAGPALTSCLPHQPVGLKDLSRRIGTDWLSFVLPQELTTEPPDAHANHSLPVPVHVRGTVHVATATVVGTYIGWNTSWRFLDGPLEPLIDDASDAPSLLLALAIVLFLWATNILVIAKVLRLFAQRRARRVMHPEILNTHRGPFPE